MCNRASNQCVCVTVCVSLSLFLELLHTEYKNLHSTANVRTFLERDDILTAPHNFKRLFQGFDLVLGLGLVGVVNDTVRSWVIHYV